MSKKAVLDVAENVDRFLFHKDHAPEGKFFSAADADPDEAGWHDTPAKFDPKYKAPPPPSTEPGTVPEEARKRGFVPAPYPSHRFHTDGVQECVVGSAEADAELDPKVWKHSPDPKTWDAKPPKAAAAQSKKAKAEVEAPPPGDGSQGDGAPAADPAAPVELKKAELAAFYKSGIGAIAEQLEAVQSVPMLTALAAAEAQNPKGPRKLVVKAITARTKALQVPA